MLPAATSAVATSPSVGLESGEPGRSSLTDSDTQPGALCHYDAHVETVRTLETRPPAAFAVDRTAGADLQSVSVQARVQERVLEDGTWHWRQTAVGPLDKQTASDTASPFRAWQSFRVGPGARRVVWDVRWYAAADPDQVTGTTTLTVAYYGRKLGSWIGAGTGTGACPGSLLGQPAIRIAHGRRSGSQVALTFDMGGGLSRAGPLLRWLVAHHVPATIFATGVATTTTPEGRSLLALIAAHRDLLDIGNHSWDHPDFAKLDAAHIRDQLDRAEAAIAPLAGGTTKPLFRPPYGIAHGPEKQAVGVAGWALDVVWDVTTTDFIAPADGGPSAAQLVAEVLPHVLGGSIVIMHADGYNTLAALPRIVAGLAQRGLHPVRLGSMLGIDP